VDELLYDKIETRKRKRKKKPARKKGERLTRVEPYREDEKNFVIDDIFKIFPSD